MATTLKMAADSGRAAKKSKGKTSTVGTTRQKRKGEGTGYIKKAMAPKTKTPKHMKPSKKKKPVDKSLKIAGAKVTKDVAGPFDKEPARKRGYRYKGRPKSSRQPFGGASGFKHGGKTPGIRSKKRT